WGTRPLFLPPRAAVQASHLLVPRAQPTQAHCPSCHCPSTASGRKIHERASFYPVYRRPLHGFPDRVSGSSTGGRSRIGQGEFVRRKFEKSFLLGALPVWVRTCQQV